MIRPATSADVPALADIYVDSARHHADLDPEFYAVPSIDAARNRIRDRMRRPGVALFAADVAGEVVGLLEIEIVQSSEGSMVGAIGTATVGLAVRGDSRGDGIGSMLIRFAERWAATQGCERVVLDMSAANADALRLYERLGYRTFGLLLRKRLASSGQPAGAAETSASGPAQAGQTHRQPSTADPTAERTRVTQPAPAAQEPADDRREPARTRPGPTQDR